LVEKDIDTGISTSIVVTEEENLPGNTIKKGAGPK
jgi:hypothetical protein